VVNIVLLVALIVELFPKKLKKSKVWQTRVRILGIKEKTGEPQ
jgi:hypothetical protein